MSEPRSITRSMRGAAALSALVAALFITACGSGDSGMLDATDASDAVSERALYCPRGDEKGLDTSELVGERFVRARQLADRYGCTVRVIKRDGEFVDATDDLRSNRVNAVVEDGLVARVDGVY